MRWIAIVLAVSVWDAPATAQEPVIDHSIVESCQADGSSLSCIGTSAEHCIETGGGSQVAYGYCYGAELDYWDDQLNRVYAEAVDAARAVDASGFVPPIGVESLREMQRAWITYRDARCELVGLSYGGGTGAGPGGTECRMRATAEQVFVLRDLRDRLN
ncbi:hypothetical protein PARPLA_02929 [Rhodobacteraceae bacterium THAF1]|uniref:lysozyme inhibitor LprI family protein n=1 Tax=Palleronia sp. THAF1 TaxID=2587842 RepID=UPI000F3BC649|nr:lysozyme inhibitor LprI family protein [Palleronia sp. THAF1]QFU08330.1 hypothetical protein FIU81_06555 [Palleronia sp. THAF1]VDC28978.1 hypothetical protein PARPLA_02929 [Rhodobacteraceae bacterium THAF1]